MPDRTIRALVILCVVLAIGMTALPNGQRAPRIVSAALPDTPVSTSLVVNGPVHTIVAAGSTVYVAGNFDSIGGQVRRNLAALDATTGTVLAWNPNAQLTSKGYMHTLAVSGSTVYAGGGFTSIGGQPRSGFAALDATTGTALAWNSDPITWVDTVVVSGSTVYVGGFFSSIGGQPRKYLAALDATTGTVLAWNPNADSRVYTLAVSGTTVYAGGYFGFIGGQPRNRIAALDATTGSATSWNPNADSSVTTLAVWDRTVYAGGDFTSIGGQPRNNIAALDATTGTALAWNPNANGEVRALAVSGSTVYAGGLFTSIGGVSRPYFASWVQPPFTAPPTFPTSFRFNFPLVHH